MSTIPEDLEDLEVDLLLAAVANRYGYDFRSYTRASVKRRIQRVCLQEQVRTISALQERLLHRPDSLHRFMSTLSVHVTAMFRDPPFYQALRERIIPVLRTYPFVRIWHAGCSTGEEVYSLAIILSEEGLYDRCRIYATDISDRLLERAQAGVFSLSSMREYLGSYLQAGGKTDLTAYFRETVSHAVMAEHLRRNVVFSRHNLLVDASFNEFHLILCRNVIIYFEQAVRSRVHQLLYDSLARFGVLALGLRENLQLATLGRRYEAVDADLRLYRKIS